jgi:simple sugar transport system permease protein
LNIVAIGMTISVSVDGFDGSIGALFVGILLNGLTKLNVQWFYQDFIKGFVLIASLAMSFYLVKTGARR